MFQDCVILTKVITISQLKIFNGKFLQICKSSMISNRSLDVFLVIFSVQSFSLAFQWPSITCMKAMLRSERTATSIKEHNTRMSKALWQPR